MSTESVDPVDGEPAPSTPDDGVLTVGALLALSGPGAPFGTAARTAVELAVNEINANGGVGGRPVRLVIRDEGADGDTASRAVDELLRVGTDVVVGPMSSLVTPIVLPALVEGGVVACSPTATAASLDSFPDDGLFVRTVASDSLQAVALARVVERTGIGSASIVHLDDPYGRPMASIVTAELESRGITVPAVVSVDANDDSYDDEVAGRLAGSGAVVVIGDEGTGLRMVDAVLEGAGPDLQVVVNDAVRPALTSRAAVQLGSEDLARLSGVSPRLTLPLGPFRDTYLARAPSATGLSAANAYDCVTMLALAAAVSGSVAGSDVVDRLVEITTSGTRCGSFVACESARAAGRNIDYDGPSGELQLGPAGDPSRASFDVFGFDASGRDVVVDAVVVSE